MADEVRLRVRVPAGTRLAALLAPLPTRDRAAAVVALAEAATGQGVADLAVAVRALSEAVGRMGTACPTTPAQSPQQTQDQGSLPARTARLLGATGEDRWA